MAMKIRSNPAPVWYLSAGLLLVCLGLLNIPFPFVADQAAVMLGAQNLQSGGTLYVDFWDNKMPALYWFYQIAGEIFSYTEHGVHLFELIWMGVFSIALMVCLRRYYVHSWLAAIAPLAVVGVYYAACESFQLTQLEILVGLPIFLAAWCVDCRPFNFRKLIIFSFLSGLCAGIAVTFKLVFAPIFVAMWLVKSVEILTSEQVNRYRTTAALWTAVSVGVGAVLGAVVLKFYFDGALRELLWTAFIYPPLALEGSPPAPYYRLLDAGAYFASYYATWLMFIAVAIHNWWRRDRRNSFTAMMIAWLLTGAVLIVMQKFSWWTYHVLLLFPPAGILGVKGIDAFAQYVRDVSVPATTRPMLITLILVFPCIGALFVPAVQKASIYIEIFLKTDTGVQGFQEAVNQNYAKIRHSVRFLNDREARKGGIYVFGDPLYYYLSRRSPAAPVAGWPWEFFTQAQWIELPRYLEKTRPPYMYIDTRNEKIMDVRKAGVREFIETHYAVLFRDHDGTWYGSKPRSWLEKS